MEWQTILERKKQIKYFKKESIDSKIIKEILQEFHDYCPSKQNATPYTITVVPNKGNKELMKHIFYHTWCKTEHLDDPRNAQVLAPYTLLFKHTNPNPIGLIEVGMAATFIAYSAINRGLEIAFCACYMDEPSADLVMGIGHRSTKSTYFNPLLNKEMPRLDGNIDVGYERDTGHIKKPMDEYIIWKP